MNPDKFLKLLQTVERIFNYKEMLIDRRVKLVTIKFKKSTFLWWKIMKRARQREDINKIVTWEKEMQNKYLPPHYRQDMFLKLHHIQ